MEISDKSSNKSTTSEAEVVTGMWTGNTDGSSVECNVTNQQDIANYATTAGTDATTCCEGYGLRGMWILGNQGMIVIRFVVIMDCHVCRLQFK